MDRRILLVGLALLWPAAVGATPPDTSLAEGTKRVEDLETLGWNAMTTADWRKQAEVLLAFARAQEASADPRTHPEGRELLIRTWVQVARASENGEATEAPFVVNVGDTPVLLGWYRAASLAYLDRDLLGKIVDPAHHGATSSYLNKVSSGALAPAYGAPPELVPEVKP